MGPVREGLQCLICRTQGRVRCFFGPYRHRNAKQHSTKSHDGDYDAREIRA